MMNNYFYHHLRGRYQWDIAVYAGVRFGCQPYSWADRLFVCTHCCLQPNGGGAGVGGRWLTGLLCRLTPGSRRLSCDI